METAPTSYGRDGTAVPGTYGMQSSCRRSSTLGQLLTPVGGLVGAGVGALVGACGAHSSQLSGQTSQHVAVTFNVRNIEEPEWTRRRARFGSPYPASLADP